MRKNDIKSNNILIVGNLGYIGPVLADYLHRKIPNCQIDGFDIGFFSANTLSGYADNCKKYLKRQIYGDVRFVDENLFLNQYDFVIYLAAISNDPMGNRFECQTNEINHLSAVNFAKLSKKHKVKKFIFASSCSVYGEGGIEEKKETSQVNPLTIYSKSKIDAEHSLNTLCDDNFNVICLRFATACGVSPRLRLDLVLNDFVASAFLNKHISILSDGSPWRPLISVQDMCAAIEWSIVDDISIDQNFISLNVGFNNWNFTIKELAEIVSQNVNGCSISINTNAAADKRSYRVNFSLYENLTGFHSSVESIEIVIRKLLEQLKYSNFNINKFRDSEFIRLNVLNNLISRSEINENLEWNLIRDATS